jgi:putative SOS response-associated peptidase YedK
LIVKLSPTCSGRIEYQQRRTTVPSNDLIAGIHDRLPAILRPSDYQRWLGTEPDPHDLLITFLSEPMKIWPISKRVNSPRNDDEDLLAEIDLAAAS